MDYIYPIFSTDHKNIVGGQIQTNNNSYDVQSNNPILFQINSEDISSFDKINEIKNLIDTPIINIFSIINSAEPDSNTSHIDLTNL